LRLRLDFTEAYEGVLRLYAVDWSSTSRRQTVSVTDSVGTGSVDLTETFSDGLWIEAPISVEAAFNGLLLAIANARDLALGETPPAR
jgi:hypothetical protein